MTFASFDFRPELLKSLTELGYDTPTPIQAKTIPLLLKGHDVIGTAQTGTGKTAAFALPILERLEPGLPGPQALILTPTRELAEQIDQNIKAYTRYLKKVSCLAVYGGVNINPQEARLRKGVDIVVATPGRLLDHLQRQTLSLQQVQYLVLDEADRMLDMGFLPDIRRILRQVPTDRQTLLFSATMPNEIRDLVESFTREARKISVSPRNTTAETVTQCVYRIEKANKLRLLTHLLETHNMYSVIVFSRTRHGADRIARQLGKQGLNVARIHADRSQNQRQQALDGFRQGKFQVLVATDIAARGIDVENISHVINFDTPTHAEDYVHRIGRTGRAEASGDAFTFTCPEEDKYLKAIEKLIGRNLPVADERSYRDLIQPAAAETSPAAHRKEKQPLSSSKPSSENSPSRQRSGERRPASAAGKPADAKAARPAKAPAEARQPAARPPQRESRNENRPAKASQPRREQPKAGQSQAAQPKSSAQDQPRQKQDTRSQQVSQRGQAGQKSGNTAQPARGQNQPARAQGQAARGQNTPARGQGQPAGYVTRSSGGSLRVVKRSKNSYPLSGEVDYIDLDDDAAKPLDDERQPSNIDANAWGYPRNPVYEPWKNKGGQSGGQARRGGGPRGGDGQRSGGDQRGGGRSRGQRRR